MNKRALIGAGTVGVGLLAIGVLVGWRLVRSGGAPVGNAARTATVMPVEVAPVRVGTIISRRNFSGSLEPAARMTIASEVSGRIESLGVDLADPVELGAVVARLDSEEAEQEVAQAEADVAVARADLVEAESAEEISRRELERTETLFQRSVASEAQLDSARATQLSRSAAIAVAKARVTRAESTLESAKIRLSYTTIRAQWQGDPNPRLVAERFVEVGDTVSANTPLMTVIDLDPIEAVVFVTERDYASLAPGMPVTVRTDAYADRAWEGTIARIAPSFREGSRQARVEIEIANSDLSLKPGMFVRVEIVLDRADGATMVPEQAVVDRQGSASVFVVSDAGDRVRLVPVKLGIRDRGEVELVEGDVSGRVVTLGQQLLDDGSPISVANEPSEAKAQAEPKPTEEGVGG